jgi:hypothetical protein
MNDPHKFGTEFGSDNAPEHSAAIVSHHDSIKWFEAIPGEQLCIRVHGTQVNGRYAIMENIAEPLFHAPGGGWAQRRLVMLVLSSWFPVFRVFRGNHVVFSQERRGLIRIRRHISPGPSAQASAL